MCVLVLHVCVCVSTLPAGFLPSSNPISKNKPECQDKELASLHQCDTHTHALTVCSFLGGRGRADNEKLNSIWWYCPFVFYYNKLPMLAFFFFAVCVFRLSLKLIFTSLYLRILFLHWLCIAVCVTAFTQTHFKTSQKLQLFLLFSSRLLFPFVSVHLWSGVIQLWQ